MTLFMLMLVVLVVFLSNILVVSLASLNMVLFMVVVSFLPCLVLVKIVWVSYWVIF
jgi:hypothetical protein